MVIKDLKQFFLDYVSYNIYQVVYGDSCTENSKFVDFLFNEYINEIGVNYDEDKEMRKLLKDGVF